MKAKNIPLNQVECAAKREAGDLLAKLMREEEAKWLQHAKVRDVLEGENNTKYQLKTYITISYKLLFSSPVSDYVKLDEDVKLEGYRQRRMPS